MSVEATEIPKLRAYIYNLPASRRLITFKHHVKYVLPSLTNCLGMTCSQSKLKRREELQKMLLEAQDVSTQRCDHELLTNSDSLFQKRSRTSSRNYSSMKFLPKLENSVSIQSILNNSC